MIKQPENLVVDAPQRQQVGRLIAVCDTALHEGDLNSGIAIVQKLEVFHGAAGRAHVYRHVGPRENGFVTKGERLVVTAFEGSSDRNL